MKEVNFKGWQCEVLLKEYYNKNKAIVLIDKYDKQLIATATVNIPEIQLEPDEVIIKDYSENEGMLKVLVDAGIVQPTGKKVTSGYVEMEICKLAI